ncbi:hypothetical protein Cme02nite_20650 [Catellatospora methionotrophica]|uniref:Uncharacterized protein n=1 Tax=Catellatospora methionotrophica TaxID=121620 RepID=A0A8J3L3L3_9ACTN|nr:hypothetical protein Cme02nite_20650 [Catellatospora methionotrophica]
MASRRAAPVVIARVRCGTGRWGRINPLTGKAPARLPVMQDTVDLGFLAGGAVRDGPLDRR